MDEKTGKPERKEPRPGPVKSPQTSEPPEEETQSGGHPPLEQDRHERSTP